MCNVLKFRKRILIQFGKVWIGSFSLIYLCAMIILNAYKVYENRRASLNSYTAKVDLRRHRKQCSPSWNFTVFYGFTVFY